MDASVDETSLKDKIDDWYKKLDENGKRKQKTWKDNIEKLVDYKAQHNDTNVKEGHELHSFVKNLRSEKVKKDNDNVTTMTDDKIDLLNQIGFVWNVNNEQWNKRLEELKQYRLDYKNCDVPRSYAQNPELGHWVNNQRRMFHNKKQKTEEDFRRIDELKNICFKFDGQRAGPRKRSRDPSQERDLEGGRNWDSSGGCQMIRASDLQKKIEDYYKLYIRQVNECQEIESQNNYLRKQMDSMHKEMDSMRKQMVNTRKENKRLNDQIAVLENEKEKLATFANATRDGKVNQLQQQLSYSKELVSLLKKRKRELDQGEESLSIQIQELSDENETLKEENGEQQEEIEGFEKKLKEKSDEVDEKFDEMERNRNEFDAYCKEAVKTLFEGLDEMRQKMFG